MKKVPHFKPDTVLRRGTFTQPLKEMLCCIAKRHNADLNLDAADGLRPRKRAEPIMEALNTLPPKLKTIMMRELFWLNRIGATSEVAATMYAFVSANGHEIPDIVKHTTFQDSVAWAFSRMTQPQWEQLITITNFRRISSNDWTQLLLSGLDTEIVVDTSDEGLKQIRDAVCTSLFNLAGLGEDGFCSHYYEASEDCDYFRLDLLGYPELKTILVKPHKVRRRNYQDMVEVDVQYNRKTKMLSICSDYDSATDKVIARAWLVGVLGSDEANRIMLEMPQRDTFNLDFIKYRSADIPVPVGSVIESAKVVLANTKKRGRGNKNFLLKSDDEMDDLHVMLINSWTANHLCADDFDVTRMEIIFTYTDADGAAGSMRCKFSRQKSNYLEAPDTLKSAIHQLLVERRIINVAA